MPIKSFRINRACIPIIRRLRIRYLQIKRYLTESTSCRAMCRIDPNQDHSWPTRGQSLPFRSNAKMLWFSLKSRSIKKSWSLRRGSIIWWWVTSPKITVRMGRQDKKGGKMSCAVTWTRITSNNIIIKSNNNYNKRSRTIIIINNKIPLNSKSNNRLRSSSTPFPAKRWVSRPIPKNQTKSQTMTRAAPAKMNRVKWNQVINLPRKTLLCSTISKTHHTATYYQLHMFTTLWTVITQTRHQKHLAAFASTEWASTSLRRVGFTRSTTVGRLATRTSTRTTCQPVMARSLWSKLITRL